MFRIACISVVCLIVIPFTSSAMFSGIFDFFRDRKEGKANTLFLLEVVSFGAVSLAANLKLLHLLGMLPLGVCTALCGIGLAIIKNRQKNRTA